MPDNGYSDLGIRLTLFWQLLTVSQYLKDFSDIGDINMFFKKNL